MIMSHHVATNAVLVESPTPVQSTESFLTEHGTRYEGGRHVAEHSLLLRVIYPKFANSI
jgi:hypothetical protein